MEPLQTVTEGLDDRSAEELARSGPTPCYPLSWQPMKVAASRASALLSDWWTQYGTRVDRLVETMFREHIEPFCRVRGWKFLAGNGGWHIGPPTENEHRWIHESYSYTWQMPDDDEELQQIGELLSTEVPGMAAINIGSLMPSVGFGG